MSPSQHSGAAGTSLLEVVFAVGLFATITAMAVPQFLSTVDELRAAGAARYVSGRLREARMEAVLRSVDVGFQFVNTPAGYGFAVYADGNGNGVRTRDIQEGLDVELRTFVRLNELFRDVDFAVLPGLPPVDPDSAPPGSDPIKLGASNILTFTPQGTSTSGTLYLRGRGSTQYAVRTLGQTGRTRVLRFAPRASTWDSL